MKKSAVIFIILLGFASAAAILAQDAVPSDEVRKKVDALSLQLDSKYFYDRESAKKELIRIGLPAQDALINVLKNGSLRARLNACEILGEIKSGRAVAPLMELYSSKDSDESLRKTIIDAIFKMPDEIEKIIGDPALNPKPVFPKEVREKLFDLRVENTLSGLIPEDNSYGHYEGQFDSLKKFDTAEVLRVLVEMFTSDDYNFTTTGDTERKAILRIAAGDALAIVGNQSIISALSVVFQDSWDKFISEPFTSVVRSPDTLQEIRDAFMFAEIAAVACNKAGENKFVGTMTEYFESTLQNLSTDNVNLDLETAERLFTANLYAGFLSRIDKDDKAIEVFNFMIAVIDKQDELSKTAGRSVKGTASIYYNLSCIYSMKGNREKAMECFGQAVSRGYDNYQWAEKDRDLDNIRDTKEFKQLIEKMKEQKKPAQGQGNDDIY